MIERITLSIEEAAEALGISRTHAYTLARTGTLPTISLGHRKVVPVCALEKMIDDGLKRAASS